MDFGDYENQQFVNYLNSQDTEYISQVMRNEIQQLNIRRQQQQQITQNINWRSVLAAKELLDDDENNYRMPIGLTLLSLLRVILTLFVLSHSSERSQFISIFTSVGLFKDLLQILYNYFLFRQIQNLKKQLYSHQFTRQLTGFLKQIENKDLSSKYKSSLLVNLILNINSFLRYFSRLIQVISWALFIYSIFIIAVTNALKQVSGISIPLIIIFTFNNYCMIIVVMVMSFYTAFFNLFSFLKTIQNIFQVKLNKYKIAQLIKKLPCQKYDNIKDKASISCCSVCLVDYTSGDLVLQLNCSTQHHFHKECILQWLDIKSNCPICRKLVFESSLQSCHQPSATSQSNNSQASNQQLEQLNQNQSNQTQVDSSQIQSLRSTICSDYQSQQQQNSENIRQKSKSDSQTPSGQNIQKIVEFIQQLKQNQQFLNNLHNQNPNQQIVDMIQENLSQQDLSNQIQNQ